MLYKKRNQSGIALVYALMLVLAFTTLMAITYETTKNSLTGSLKELNDTQALNLSRSGLQDASAWFTRQANIVRRSSTTCITPGTSGYGAEGDYSDNAFQPTQRTSFTDIADTDDASIGIVRDIPLDKNTNMYGHYEVRRQKINNECGSGDPNLKTDENAVHDITHLKKMSQSRGDGHVWRIVSIGYLYRRGDLSYDPATGIYLDKCCENMSPTTKNQIINKKILTAELNRLNLDDPGSAISILNASNVICTDTRSIIAPGSVFSVKAGSGSLSANVANNVSQGPNDLTTVSGLNLSVEKVFGMTRDVLSGVSNYSETTVTNQIANTRHQGKLIFIDNNATFTNAKPLKGSGILFVKGNLIFDSNSQSYFSGLIYVENGDLTIKEGNTLSGSIIVAGSGKKITLTSPSGDVASVEYNKEVLDSVRKKLANYRLNRFSYKVIQ